MEAHPPGRVVAEDRLFTMAPEALFMVRGDRTERQRPPGDDVGTGCSSVSRLKHMPVDVMRIDRESTSIASAG